MPAAAPLIPRWRQGPPASFAAAARRLVEPTLSMFEGSNPIAPTLAGWRFLCGSQGRVTGGGQGIIRRFQEVVVATVTVQLSDQQIKTLKARTGKRNAEAALKAWVIHANPKRSSAALKVALKESLKQENAGKGQRFRSGREAIRWLES